jgi:hypothetical protein
MIKISALPAAFGTSLTDIVPIVQAGVTKKLSIKDLTESLSPTEVVDSFEVGATLNTRNQVLRLTATGALYRWNGALPKIVFPNSTPASSGGISAAAWSLVIQNQASGFRTVVELGAVCNGIADDGPKILEILENYGEAVIPPNLTIRIGTPFVMPLGTSIKFMGGLGNTLGQLPASYFIKPASVNGPLIIMTENCRWEGGGVLGITGNTGDGVQIHGNGVHMARAFIGLCGGRGLRIGKDSAFQNCNSFNIDKVITALNGDDGLAVHDGWADTVAGGLGGLGQGRGADANAGKLDSCFSYQNGGHGIYLGRTWWTTVVNALTEGNGGYGMYCDDTVVAPDTVARCRYVNIIGGDFNEGNAGGSLYFKGYAGGFYCADANQEIEYGGVLNNVYGGGANNVNWGQTINRFLYINAEQGEAGDLLRAKYPLQLNKTVSGTPGDVCGIAIRANNTNFTPPYDIAATFEAEYKEQNEWMGVIRVRDGNGDNDPGQLVRGLVVDPRFKRWYAGADNVWTLGDRIVRFAGIYSTFPTYANDAVAGLAGEPMGTVYRTPSSTVLRVRDGSFTGDVTTNVINLRGSTGTQIVATGFVRAGNVAQFYVPCNFGRVPVSIAVTGTFQIRSLVTGSTNVTTASFTLHVSSSQNMAVIQFSGLTGSIADGDPLVLETISASSNIQINF